MEHVDSAGDAKKTTVGRRHVTTACITCRDTKSRCDGKQPSCGQCFAKNRECAYPGKLDKRKVSLRKTVELFCRRVKQLETHLIANGIEVPQVAAKNDEFMMKELISAYASPQDIEAQVAAIAHEPAEQTLASPEDAILSDEHFCSGSTNSIGTTSIPFNSRTSDPALSDNSNSTILQEPYNAADDLCYLDPTIDVDWIWSASAFPLFQMGSYTGFNVDALPPVNSIFAENVPETYQMQTPHSLGDVDITDDEELPEVAHQFSDRLGSLLTTHNGESRFYGATSNLHLLHSRHTMERSSALLGKQKQARNLLEVHGIGQDIDPQLVNHLINLYFTWQNPVIHVVDRRTFEVAQLEAAQANKSDRTTMFFSELLLNAICAVGALQCNSRHPEYPGALPQFFADRAKVLLDHELDYPRIATVQALAILSIYESTSTKDTRGWLYSGMAMRLALDLGLHLSSQPYVQNGTMGVDEAQVRRTAFWGSFTIDRMWGIYLGRPFHLSFSDISVERPHAAASDDLPSWTPYDNLGKIDANNDQADYQGLVVERWLALFEIMSSLGHMLYAKIDASKIELQALAQHTFEQLIAWEASLPKQLSVDMRALDSSPRLPHVLMLHMHFALFKILLHRPFVSKHYIQPSPQIGSGHHHAREMCVRSAVDVSKLITCYKKQYSLQRCSILVVHIVFSAALILVYATVSESNASLVCVLQPHLETCCQALAELGNMFENAARSLDILLAVKRTWQARMVVGFPGKRPASRKSNASGSSSHKRFRSLTDQL